MAEERTYSQVYNSKWRVLNGPLATKIRRLMITLFKALVKSPKELRVAPGLSTGREILASKEQIDQKS